ncbi:WG repeat-containing protein [bacterium]|nr:WG repeat-containing protein [bacterium]
MKKFSVLLALTLVLSCNYNLAQASCHRHGSSCSSCVYVVRSDNFQEERTFPKTDKYSLFVDTTINYYSNGSKRTYYNYTIFKQDGSVLASNCSDVQHVLVDNKDYFLIKKGSYYKILDSKALEVANRKYTRAQEVMPNRILVRVNKRYGIIDIKENVIVPIKYKEFTEVGNNLFITKLNGYYGMIDSSNKVYLKDEYDRIKPLYDTYLIKKAGKYGIVDIKGNIILDANCDKIKKMGEYIIVEKDNLYGVYDSLGNKISDIEYKKVKLERNQLKIKKDGQWQELL